MLRVLALTLVCVCVFPHTHALSVGQTYPANVTEAQAVRPIKSYIYPTSAQYAALVKNTNPSILYSDSNVMSQRMSDHLDRLAAKVDTTLKGIARLQVVRAYVIPPARVNTSDVSLHYEGRAAVIRLFSLNGSNMSSYMDTLANLAVNVGLDYIRYDNRSSIYTSVIPDKCTRKIDLVFLLDGSASIDPADFARAKQFISDVASYFDIGPNATRVGVATFYGYGSHISTIPGYPNCPNGTNFETTGLGCICPPAATCRGPVYNPFRGIWYGCRTGVTSTGQQLAYFDLQCTTCTCSFYYSTEDVVTNFDLNQFARIEDVQAAVQKIPFPAGATHTSSGLRHVRTKMLVPEAGVRPLEEGVPRVLVVITDGQANPGYEPGAEAKLLRDQFVSIFAMGVSDYYLPELNDMATDPDSEHVFLLATYTQIFDFVDRISTMTCDEASLLNPGTTTETSLNRGAIKYFRPLCASLTDKLNVQLADIEGQSNLYVGFDNPTPGPLKFDYKNESSSPVKTIQIVRDDAHKNSIIYIGVLGLNATTSFQLDVWNDLFSSLRLRTSTVMENATIGTEVFPAITSSRPNLAYSISKGNEDSTFAMDASTGRIITAKRLDRETVASYQLRLMARDNNVECLAGGVDVTVNVGDINDNAPYFHEPNDPTKVRKDFVVLVKETTMTQERLILTIGASDPDEGLNGLITFTAINAPPGFRVDPKTGAVYTTIPFDFETTTQYIFSIRASDNGNPSLSAVATITINVEDINDNFPVFDPRSYEATVSEADALAGRVLVSLKAADKDVGDVISFRLNTNDDSSIIFGGFFNLNLNTGVITPRKETLTFVTATTYRASVLAVDTAGQSDVASVVITVKPSNQPPKNLRLTENKVSETAALGTVVGQLLADDDPLQTLTWRLLSDAGGVFRLAGSQILVNARLNSDVFPTYSINVSCSDNGVPSLTSQTTFTIVVLAEDETPGGITLSSNTVPENSPVGYVIGRLSASDPDDGDFLTFSLDDSAFGRLSVGASTCVKAQPSGVTCSANLVVSGNFDFEARSEWETIVRVTDATKRFRVEVFSIKVLDQNDRPTRVYLTIDTVPEDLPVDSTVSFLLTEDQDRGQTFRYELLQDGNGVFALDSKNTSRLVLVKPLDYETASSIPITVRVTDSGVPPLSLDAGLLIKIINVNEPPVWQQSEYSFDIPEKSPAGTFVGRVSARDPEGKDVLYSMFSQNGVTRFFSLNPKTGDITVLSSEGLAVDQTFVATLTASDTVLEASSILKIRITPAFQRANFSIALDGTTVNENALSGDVVGTLSILRPEIGRTYTMSMTSSAGGRFAVRGNKVVVGDGSLLDFETAQNHTIRVRALDDNGVPRAAEVSFVITVLDLNEAPVFAVNPINVQVPENSDPGTLIAVLNARDPDSPKTPFGKISYAWSPLTVKDGFSLDPANGTIVTVASYISSSTGKLENFVLDYETRPSYTLIADAVDGGGLRASVTVNVAVLDINERPSFDRSNYAASISENAPRGTTIMTLSARDPDSGSNGRLTYSIIHADVGFEQAFAINAATGTLTTTGLVDFDYETKSLVRIVVQAADGGGLIAVASVSVEIQDVNEAPKFAKRDFTVSVSESVPPGTRVLTLEAKDADANDVITFSIKDVTPGFGKLFSLNPASGEVSTLKGLDFQVGSTYVASATVTDSHGLSDSANVIIIITDTNNPPTAISLVPDTVNENSPRGTVVGKLIATDSDSTVGFVFSLLDDASGRFMLEVTGDETRVVVANQALLDFEQAQVHILNVKVIDNGVPAGVFEGPVRVVVQDVNEAPYFDRSLVATQIKAGATAGTPIYTAKALDPDAGKFGVAAYELIPSEDSSFFKIAPTTGAITLAKPLSFSGKSEYRIRVTARDGGNLYTPEPLQIVVTQEKVQLGNPVFGGPYTVKIARNQPVGSRVLTVQAADPSGNTAAKMEYTILGGNDYNVFSINSSTGVIKTLQMPSKATLSGLRRRRADLPEKMDLTQPLSLVIQARSLDNPTLKSSTAVTANFFEGCSPSPCIPGYACADAFSPLTWTVCNKTTEYEAREGSLQQDRICMPCTPCARNEYRVGGCDGKIDSICKKRRTCNPLTEFESNAGTATSDRVCTICKKCAAGEALVSACSATSDAVCALRASISGKTSCERGLFRNSTGGCQPCDACAFGTYVAPGSCQGETNAVCLPWRTCSSGKEYLRILGTASSDAECSTCTVCPPGVDILRTCSEGSDTLCDFTPAGTCECPNGFTGPTCEIPTGACFSSPCKNGGTCYGNANGYACECPPTHFGKTCENVVPYTVCSTNPCGNGKVCVVDAKAASGYRCDTVLTTSSPDSSPNSGENKSGGLGGAGATAGIAVGAVIGLLLLLLLIVILVSRRGRKSNRQKLTIDPPATATVDFVNPLYFGPAANGADEGDIVMDKSLSGHYNRGGRVMNPAYGANFDDGEAYYNDVQGGAGDHDPDYMDPSLAGGMAQHESMYHDVSAAASSKSHYSEVDTSSTRYGAPHNSGGPIYDHANAPSSQRVGIVSNGAYMSSSDLDAPRAPASQSASGYSDVTVSPVNHYSEAETSAATYGAPHTSGDALYDVPDSSSSSRGGVVANGAYMSSSDLSSTRTPSARDAGVIPNMVYATTTPTPTPERSRGARLENPIYASKTLVSDASSPTIDDTNC